MDLKVSACIGCGFCCTKALCTAALRLYSTRTPPCPALRWDGERNYCELMTLPGIIGEGYRKELYAGEGCCMNLNTWRKELLQDRTKVIEKGNDVEVPKMLQQFLFCLGKEMISGDKLYFVFSYFEDVLKKDGYTEEQAKRILNKCINLVKNQRSSFINGFIGAIPE